MNTTTNLEKFNGTKPLLEYPPDNYPRKLYINYIEADFNMWTMHFQAIEKSEKIIYGLKGQPKDFIKYDFLQDLGGGEPGIICVHKRMLDTMLQMCPNDFEHFNMTIKNLTNKQPAFENKDFYLINALHTIDALDEKKTEIEYWQNGRHLTHSIRGRWFFKENPWDGHMIARDRLSGRVVWHPKLAGEFRNSKGIEFLTDEEKPL